MGSNNILLNITLLLRHGWKYGWRCRVKQIEVAVTAREMVVSVCEGRWRDWWCIWMG